MVPTARAYAGLCQDQLSHVMCVGLLKGTVSVWISDQTQVSQCWLCGMKGLLW